MRLLIVLPFPYSLVGRRKRGHNALGYLLTIDPTTSPAELIQVYLDRWKIEVLPRDREAGLGVGQVQASREAANERARSAHVAAYSMLNLAALKVIGGDRTSVLTEIPA
jgi:hypothetical protein